MPPSPNTISRCYSLLVWLLYQFKLVLLIELSSVVNSYSKDSMGWHQFCIFFCIKQCIPQIIFSILSIRVLKHFYKSLEESRENPNKLFVHLKDGWMLTQYLIGPHGDAAEPALGRQSVTRLTLPISHFHTLINVSAFWSTVDSTFWEGGYFWYEVLHNSQRFINMTIYDLEVGHKTSLVFFSDFEILDVFPLFLFKISRPPKTLYMYIFFLNWHVNICCPFNIDI